MQTHLCPTEQELSAFDLGNLRGERYEEVSQHLDSCTQCARKFETLHTHADGLIDDLRQPLPSEILMDDSELRRLMESAAKLDTALAAQAETQPSKPKQKPSHEQIAAQLLTPAQAEGELGRLGGYRVLEVLGAGGMGVVFKAEDPGLKRQVALKAILPNVADVSNTARERFLREAQTTASIQHDNIVTIYQVGQDRDVAFLAMQLLEGESLSARLHREQRLPIADVLQIARETAQGLAAAHAKGLTHRDIKPDNLWLEESRDQSQESRVISKNADPAPLALDSRHSALDSFRLKILDFGLARAMQEQSDLTCSGMVVGTPSYLAPEQARGEKVDARADLFSLGVVMYQMLTGSKPFARESLTGTLLAIINDTPLPLPELRDDVPPALVELVNRLLAKDAGQRPASANEVVREIRALEGKLSASVAPLTPIIPLTPSPSPARGEGSKRTLAPQAASRKSPPRKRTLIAVGAVGLALLAGIIVIIRNKDGKEIARIEAPDGSTIETKSTDPTPPVVPTLQSSAPAAPQPAPVTDHLPRMSPIALVERPAKIVAKDGGEPVESWTIAPTLPTQTHLGGAPLQFALRGDGKRIAVLGADGDVRVWDVPSGRLVQVLVGHTEGATSNARRNSRRYAPLAWQPRGTRLATASQDGSLRVWDVDRGVAVFVHPGARNDLNFVAWSPDGTKLAASYRSKAVRIWSSTDWQLLMPLDGLTDFPRSLVWSPDSGTLAVVTESCRLFSLANLSVRVVPNSIRKHESHVPSVRWSPQGDRLAHIAGSKVVVRDAVSLDVSAEIGKEGTANYKALDFDWSPDGKQLLVAWSVDGKADQNVYDAATGNVTASFQVAMNTAGDLPIVEWLPDGRTVVIAASLIDLKSQAVLGSFNRFHEWSDDGNLVLGTNIDFYPVVHRHVPAQKTEPVFVGRYISVPTLWATWSPDGQYLTLSDRKTIVNWREHLSATSSITFPTVIQSWSPDTRHILKTDGGMEIWSWADRKKLHGFQPTVSLATKFPGLHAWSPDGRKLALASASTSPAQMQVLDATSGTVTPPWTVPKSDGSEDNCLFIEWSRQGDRIAAFCRRDLTLRILSSSDGSQVTQTAPITSLTNHTTTSKYYWSSVKPLWSPDDKHAFLGFAGAILKYEASDGRLVREFDVGVSPTCQPVWLNGTTIQVATSAGDIVRLDVTTGTLTPLSTIAGMPAQFSPDGRYLATDQRGTRQIVRVADGETVVSLSVNKALVSPEGHLWTPANPRGAAWAVNVRDQFAYIVRTASGQQTLTPAEFANKYGWQNDPSQVRLGEPVPAKIETPPPSTSPDLPPLSPTALVQRPAKIVAKDGGAAVQSWTVATGPTPAKIDLVPACALRPDGKRLATFSEDGHVRIWNVELNGLEKVLAGHGGGPAYAYLPAGKWGRTNARRFGPLTWHPQGTWLASVSRDGSLRVWDTASGRVVWQQAAAPGDLNMAAWSPDGTLLAAGCYLSQAVRIWSTADWKEQKALDRLGRAPSELQWSPDSSTLAVGSSSLVLYKPRSAALQVLPGVQVAYVVSGSPSVRWSPDGKLLAHRTSTSVVISEAPTLKRIREIRQAGAAQASLRDFAWSPDGRQLLIGWQQDGKASQTIHDVTTGEIARTLDIALLNATFREYLEWLPDGRTLLINSKLVDLESQAVLGEFSHVHEWSDDGRRVSLYNRSNATTYVYQLDTPHKPEVLSRATSVPLLTSDVAAWSPDGRNISLGRTRRVISFDAQRAFLGLRTPPRDIGSWAPDGKQTLSSIFISSTPVVCQWPSGADVQPLKLPFGTEQHALSPDGSKIVFSKHDGYDVRILDTSSGETLREWTLPSIGGGITSLDWHGDRIAIVVPGSDGTAVGYVCAAADGATIYSLPSENWGRLIRWLPGGQQLLRFGRGEKTWLYDAKEGRLLRELPISVSGHAVHFIDQETLLCATTDGKILRVNLASGQSEVVSQFAGEAQLFSPNAELLVCDLAAAQRMVRVADGQTLWSIVDADLLISPEGHLQAHQLPTGAAWAASPVLKDKLVYIVQTADGQQTLTPAEFANKYGWQNDPSQVRLK